MNRPVSTNCPRCGAPIPAGSADQLCPACLMSGALAASGDETVSSTSSRSPALPGPTRFPCEFGDYRLSGLLGSGGMGAVYEAEHLPTGRRVALKMLGLELDSPEMRQRFLREGRLAAGVSHPNSLYIFGSEEIDGVPVIIMEIAGGGTLKDTLKKRGPLPAAEAVDAILDVIAGLEAALAAGVLHRDIKPSNCFVSPDGSIKIGDFGLSVSTLAKDDTYVTASGIILGTPAFASPEQLCGDDLDLRADIYSVGATLFTLLTDRAPFGGENAVQVVANAMNQAPQPVGELRDDVPPGLERLVARCLAKQPDGRFADYAALRDALLPFSSREPEPASLKLRVSSGWIDYLAAFLIPYVMLMLSVGNEEFHLRFLIERTLSSARYYLAFLAFGLLYFSTAEGIWGAGLGKRFKGLRVIRPNGRSPGFARALVRILIPILCIEGVRLPFLLATISATSIDAMTAGEVVLYTVATTICPLIPIVLATRARRENRFTTIWDRISGTRVVVKPQGAARPAITPVDRLEIPGEAAATLGPYRIAGELVPGRWMVGADPVLRRGVWLLRRGSADLSIARRNLARPGRLRWLQEVDTDEGRWDAFEAPAGAPLLHLVEDGKGLPWETLRHWLHDLASELWAAARDQTLPAELGLDQIWITAQGHAVLLDAPWPEIERPAERIAVGDISGQQRLLSAVAAYVESTGLPLHARPVLQSLHDGKFEKLSFLTGVLRGLLDRPAEVGRGIRAASIFMFPLYVGVMIFVGLYTGERAGEPYGPVGWILAVTTMLVLGVSALIQILGLPFRTTGSHGTLGLAVVNARGELASVGRLLARWAIVWLPLLLLLAIVALLGRVAGNLALIAGSVVVLWWIGAAIYAVMHPNRGLHDRLAGTWVVRR